MQYYKERSKFEHNGREQIARLKALKGKVKKLFYIK